MTKRKSPRDLQNFRVNTNTSLKASFATSPARSIPFLTVVGVVVVLYFGQDFFLPLALAVLISFLLAPVIRGLERSE